MLRTAQLEGIHGTLQVGHHLLLELGRVDAADPIGPLLLELLVYDSLAVWEFQNAESLALEEEGLHE